MTLYLLNILDLIFTLYALSHGGVELNPISRAMLELHPMFYATYKAVVVGLLCWWLSTRYERIAKHGMMIATVSYVIVDVWHIMNIFFLLE